MHEWTNLLVYFHYIAHWFCFCFFLFSSIQRNMYRIQYTYIHVILMSVQYLPSLILKNEIFNFTSNIYLHSEFLWILSIILFSVECQLVRLNLFFIFTKSCHQLFSYFLQFSKYIIPLKLIFEWFCFLLIMYVHLILNIAYIRWNRLMKAVLNIQIKSRILIFARIIKHIF